MVDSTNTSIKLESELGDALFPLEMRGFEGISELPEFSLTALSERGDIQVKEVLGKSFALEVAFEGANKKGKRRYGGYCIQMVKGGKIGRYFSYLLILRPWFWMLTQRVNSRVFQKKSTVEIIKLIFAEHAIAEPDYSSLKETYKPRRYCIQYNESDFTFLSRLMEEEGIYYWFEYEDAKQKLVFADGPSAHKDLPLGATLNCFDDFGNARGNEVTGWYGAGRHYSGKHASIDYDFKKSKVNLNVGIAFAGQFDQSDFEVFEYPGGYFETGDGEKLAKIRALEIALPNYHAFTTTNWPDVKVGELFKLDRHADKSENAEYLILGSAFTIAHPGYEGMDWAAYATSTKSAKADFLRSILELWPGSEKLQAHIASGQSVHHANCEFHLRVIRSDPAFRPPRKTPKVRMPGPQTAVVVGPKGEEIYADEFGRVKVQFHWDREGKKDDNSTCYLRVSQPWAGKGWGGYFIPRIGQEVVVEFLNGDPDRPLITGRVYNDDQTIPFEVHTQSGFRTHSTPKGGTDNFNELRFEDKKGQEHIFIHAEKDYHTRIKNDELESVGNDLHLTVKADQMEKISGDMHLTVTGDQNEKISGTISQQAGMEFQQKTGTNYAVDAGQAVHIKAGMTAVIEAGMSLTLKVGGNFIMLSPAGVTIVGSPAVMINSGGSAGSGAGSSPASPKAPKEPLDGKGGESGQPGSATPTTWKFGKKGSAPPGGGSAGAAAQKTTPAAAQAAAQAAALEQAAEDGTPFCEKCEQARQQQAGSNPPADAAGGSAPGANSTAGANG